MDYQACGDAQLAALVRAGQGEAFAELSARYLGLIRAKAKLFEGASAPEKEDLWQEGLLGLVRRRHLLPTGAGGLVPHLRGGVRLQPDGQRRAPPRQQRQPPLK